MKKLYIQMERSFESVTSVAMAILGNSITFVLALCTVILWMSNKLFYTEDIHDRIGDLILGVTFLSMFIIQKSVNRSHGSLHLKVNELVASHEHANNEVINSEEKSELEIKELSKKYSELAQPTITDNKSETSDLA